MAGKAAYPASMQLVALSALGDATLLSANGATWPAGHVIDTQRMRLTEGPVKLACCDDSYAEILELNRQIRAKTNQHPEDRSSQTRRLASSHPVDAPLHCRQPTLEKGR